MVFGWTIPRISAVEILIAFLVTCFTTPILIKLLKHKGIIGVDVHKPDKPIRAKMCGLSTVIGFTSALTFSILLLPRINFQELAVLLQATIFTVLLSSAIGVYDDLYNIRQRHKVILLLLAAAPLAWTLQNRSTLYLPFFGSIYIGFLFPLLLIPVGISGAANLTNMLAGFNGLEAGLGSMALGAVAIAAIVLGKTDSFMIAIAMAVSLFAFLIYNWYPAEAFPGDAGTLAIGASLACAVIVGEIEILGVLVLIPHIIDFFLKLFGARGKSKLFKQRMIYGDTKVTNDGVLHPPPYRSFPHVLMKIKPMTEKGLVKSLVLCEALFGLLVIILSLMK